MLGHSQSQRISTCADLIGLPYLLGADGTEGCIDCIHLVYEALRVMGVPTPAFKPHWYDLPKREIMRDITGWGNRIASPTYDGDVSLLPDSETGWAFGVTWNDGILHINRAVLAVSWSPVGLVQISRSYRYSLTNGR